MLHFPFYVERRPGPAEGAAAVREHHGPRLLPGPEVPSVS